MCRERTDKKMQSLCTGEACICFKGCCLKPFPAPSEPQISATSYRTTSRHEFAASTASSLYPNTQFTNHEAIPSLEESLSNFIKAYPLYLETSQTDQIRAKEYSHLSQQSHVCLDYIGHGLFSYGQQQSPYGAASIGAASIASTSSPPSPSMQHSSAPFFDILNKTGDLYSQIMYGGQESEFDSLIRKRIMSFMNISEDDYSMVFTANQLSAFKLLSGSYLFQSGTDLLTVYDYDNEATEAMIDCSKKKGAQVMSAEFSWPKMRIQSTKLRKMIMTKRKNKRGLFVFPLQSKMTGARYSYLWMNMAQENGWHVLLDASALGAKEMETLGLSFFKPDFLFCSFYKIFGEDPSGFGCLLVKKSSAPVLNNSISTGIGIVRILPSARPCQFLDKLTNADKLSSNTELKEDTLALPSSSSGSMSFQQNEETSKLQETQEAEDRQKQQPVSEIVELSEITELDNPLKTDKSQNKEDGDTIRSEMEFRGQKQQPVSEIVELSEITELDNPLKTDKSQNKEDGDTVRSEMEFRGLDHADSLGLILISCRARYLVNWLVNALTSLKHPHSENGLPLVTIYGPKVRFDRGPAVAFNMFDWKGEKVDPALVQKLADRSNISLSCGFLKNIYLSDMQDNEKNSLERKNPEHARPLRNKKDKGELGISVITASLGFLTNFEDAYRLWAFTSKFLDADFVEKEKWRYTALNQTTIEV